MQIIDNNTKVEQRFYEERQKQKREKSTQRKIYDHNLLNRNKKFFDQQSRSSPKFSSKMSRTDSFGKSEFIEEDSQNNNRITTTNNSQKIFQKNQSSKYLDISIGYEFSPYSKPLSRTYHNQSVSNKQNIMASSNNGYPTLNTQIQLDKIMIKKSIESDKQKIVRLEFQNKQLRQRQEKYKLEIKTLKEQFTNQQYKQQLRVKCEELYKLQFSLSEANRKIYVLSNQLDKNAIQLSKLRRYQQNYYECQNILNCISAEVFREFKDLQFQEGLQQYLKKNKKNNEFIKSILSIKQKLTGCKQQNLKQVWRWLKKLIHELYSIQDFLESLKSNLHLSNEASFEQLKMRIIKKLSK